MSSQSLIDSIRKAIEASRRPETTLREVGSYLEGLVDSLEKEQGTMTRELADTLFPDHGRTSCSDTDTRNGYVHYENGGSRCHRCLALNNIGEPLTRFEIEAWLRILPDRAELRARALVKLTAQERQALGLQ